MPEIVAFVKNGAAKITPKVVEDLVRLLPMWKAGFTQIKSPEHPHLVGQLLFLADLVEDVAEGAYKELPYATFAEAVFALTYCNRGFNIIPDTIPGLGRADDSSVVRAVMIQNEKHLEKYAQKTGVQWKSVTNKA
jgi:uncharacterized membrane protein YkvA (DUF1232 family)